MLSTEEAAEALARQYVLDTLAAGESGGSYNKILGGEMVNDLSVHPNRKVPIPGTELFSTAAGRYGFLKGTWDEEADKLGLKDFLPAAQDSAAWDLAQNVYLKKTGRALSLDAKARTVDWSALSGTWTSLAKKDEGEKPPDDGSFLLDLGSAGSATAAPAPLAQDMMQKLMSKKYAFTPVDYDPFQVEKTIKGSEG